MSYARWSPDSDVYIYEGRYTDGTGYITCLCCPLDDEGDEFITSHRSEMVTHVEEHINEGHAVPWWTLGDLTADLLADGDLIIGDRPGGHA